MIAFCVIILYLINLIKKTLIGNNKWLSIFILILTIVILLMTSSRKSSIAFLIIIIGEQFIFNRGNKLKSYIKISIFLISLIAGISWGLNNTEVGERIIKTAEQTINANEDEERFDGRMVQYVEGYEVFKNYPLLGIGLFNYRYIDRFGLELHSEYLVQLVESGLIGTLLFLLFYGYIIYNLLKVHPKSTLKKTSNVLILSFLVYGVLFFGTWVYNMSMFWIIIGIAIKIIRLDKYIRLKKTYKIKTLNANTINK
jgi:O-antigen ligase